jgi:hypothetical protein
MASQTTGKGARKDASMFEGAAKIGIEYKKDADFSKWYQQVSRKRFLFFIFF